MSLTLQELLDTISENPQAVRQELKLLRKRMNELTQATGVATDDILHKRVSGGGPDQHVLFEDLLQSAEADRGWETRVDSVADLRTTSFPANLERLWLSGYYGAGTPGGGEFYADRADTTTADNGGTVFVDADGVRWKRYYENIGVVVTWFGAKRGDPSFNNKAAFEAANAVSKLLWVPSGDWELQDFNCDSRTTLWGTGSRRQTEGLASNLTSSVQDSRIIAFPALDNLQTKGIMFSATATGVSGVESDDFSDYLQNSLFEDTYFQRSLHYGVKANIILSEFRRCFFMQYGSPQGTQDRYAVLSDSSNQGGLATNLVVFNNCNINATKATAGSTAAVKAVNGSIWVFRDCDFENMEGPAYFFSDVRTVHFTDGCWFESISSGIAAGVAQDGTRIYCTGNKFQNNANTTWPHFVDLGTACFIGLQGCDGNMGAGYISNKNGLNDEGVLYNQGSSLVNYPGDLEQYVSMVRLEVDTYNRVGYHRQVGGLTDSPGSPEAIDTFAIPAPDSSVFTACIDIEATVQAANSDESIVAVDEQTLKITVTRLPDGSGDVQIQSINSRESLFGGASWSSNPSWSADISGTTLTLRMTSNPLGGNFSNIKAVLNGSIWNKDGSDSGEIVGT